MDDITQRLAAIEKLNMVPKADALAVVRDLRADGGEWAKRVASEWAARTRSARASGALPWKWAMREPLGGIVFLALVRAGIPIDREWEPLFPSANFIFSETRFDVVRECARGLAPDRVAPTVAHCLALHALLDDGIAVLQDIDSAEVARMVLGMKSVVWPRPKLLAALGKIATRKPNVAEVLEETTGKGGKRKQAVSLLTTRDVLRPKSDAKLKSIQKKQLAIAVNAWGGEDQPVFDLLEIRSIVDAAGAHKYDAFILGGDSGTIFRAGTTSKVAEVIQTGVQCKNEALMQALGDALARKQTKRK